MCRSDLAQTAPQSGRVLVWSRKIVKHKQCKLCDSADEVDVHKGEDAAREKHHCEAVNEQLPPLTSSLVKWQMIN